MGEHIGNLNLYGDSIEVNTDNTSLWEHKEEPELDHVYVRLPERYNEGEQARAFYLWRHIGASATAFALFREALLEEPDAEVHTNIRFAGAVDREEYQKVASREIEQADWNDPKLW